MKKSIIGIFVALAVISCNQSSLSSQKTIDKLENDDQKASYAFGTSLGESISQVNSRMDADSINYEQLNKGLNDYFKGGKDKESYAIGQQVGQQVENVIKQQNLEEQFNKDIIVQGIMDVVRHKKLLISQEAGMAFLESYARKNAEDAKVKNLEKSNTALEDKKKDKNVKTTPSGLAYEVIKEGEGPKPTKEDFVKVKYTGKILSSGKVFDSTDKSNKGEAVDLPLAHLIPGWTEGIQLMSKGASYKFYIPINLAYGENGDPSGQIGQNQALEFLVELVDFQKEQPKSQQLNADQPQLTEEQMKAIQQQMEEAKKQQAK